MLARDPGLPRPRREVQGFHVRDPKGKKRITLSFGLFASYSSEGRESRKSYPFQRNLRPSTPKIGLSEEKNTGIGLVWVFVDAGVWFGLVGFFFVSLFARRRFFVTPAPAPPAVVGLGAVRFPQTRLASNS